MALIKAINTQYGVDANYWKIVDLNINWLSKSSHVVLLGWTGEEARREGNQPIASRSFDWDSSVFPFEIETLDQKDKNPVKVAYEKIKSDKVVETNLETGKITETKGEFADAEDL